MDQTRLDQMRMEAYKSGNVTYLHAATDEPLRMLRQASDNAARVVADYRRAVKVAEGYKKAHPGVPAPDNARLTAGGIALPNPSGPDVEKARRKYTQIAQEVEHAEAGVRRASQEVRTALGVGTRYLREDETHPMLQHLYTVESELRTGSPQLKTALQKAQVALEDPAGGVDLHALPGWGDGEIAHIGESAYTPEPEGEWWDGLGGHTFERLQQPATKENNQP